MDRFDNRRPNCSLHCPGLNDSTQDVVRRADLWSFKFDFLLVSFAYVFPTTNLLNLPRLAYENGGLAFLSAYAAAAFVIVLPIIILELSVGQLTGRAPVQALYNMCPVFRGVGVAQILFSIAVMAYMTRYLGWLFLYIFHLFWTILDDRPGLPWLHCKNFPELQSRPCREAGAIANFTHDTHTKLNAIYGESSLVQFMVTLEQPSRSIDYFGNIQYYILSAEGAVWILVFFAICFGVRWLGKVVCFTFIASLVLLLLLLGRAMLLVNGDFSFLVKFYEITDWNRLADYHVWKIAVEQAILATGIGFGAFITIGSYNKRSNNLVGDSFIITIMHLALSALQLLTILSFVGFISHRTGLNPMQLMDKGESQMWHFLAYMSYLPDFKAWSGITLFMCSLIILNIFYMLAMNVLSSLEDAFGERWSRCVPRFFLAFFICAFCFGTSVYFATQAGKHAYQLVSGYLKYITLWTILAFELIAVSWFYCAHSLGKDLRSMLSGGCCWCLGHFLLFITYLLPVVPIAIAVLNVMGYTFDAYSEEIHEWEFSEYVGLAIAVVPLLPIPLVAQFTLCRACCCKRTHRSKCSRFRHAFASPLRYEIEKGMFHSTTASGNGKGAMSPPRYTSTAPGYVLLPQSPQAPLAEPEQYNDLRR
ncbi:hypothetical protein QR680_010685 [Steinernema hermaphroditum]|uniref:Transporter n=1 Tax=Steinernema hermaphroditum TaxID=289476 RepID=A0AA39MC72_9BILA|nr:hypothetical protein QR680_010685 [Steinernema hermaphroditum]